MRLTEPQITTCVALVKELAENPEEELTKEEISLMMDYKNENPHGYEAFFIEGLTIYAVNETAAKAKADKILRKKTVQ